MPDLSGRGESVPLACRWCQRINGHEPYCTGYEPGRGVTRPHYIEAIPNSGGGVTHYCHVCGQMGVTLAPMLPCPGPPAEGRVLSSPVCGCERSSDDGPDEVTFCCRQCDGNGWDGPNLSVPCRHCHAKGWHQ
jgi:hypothetical protein